MTPPGHPWVITLNARTVHPKVTFVNIKMMGVKKKYYLCQLERRQLSSDLRLDFIFVARPRAQRPRLLWMSPCRMRSQEEKRRTRTGVGGDR